VLGKQTFKLRTETRTRARIILDGPISLNEEASYHEEPLRGGVSSVRVKFNAPTLELLSRYRTRIRSTTYHVDGDYAMLELKPPLIPRILVKLHRMQ
jgi:hypothetical protein